MCGPGIIEFQEFAPHTILELEPFSSIPRIFRWAQTFEAEPGEEEARSPLGVFLQ